jgi:hypothetical protein
VLIPKARLDVYHRLGHGSQPFWRGAGTTISLPGAVRRRRGLLWRASKKFERKGVMGVRAATERFAGRIEPLGPCHRPDARRGNGARREGPERARPHVARACRRAASLGAAFHRLWAAGRGACRGENAQRGGAMERGRKGAHPYLSRVHRSAALRRLLRLFLAEERLAAGCQGTQYIMRIMARRHSFFRLLYFKAWIVNASCFRPRRRC